MAGSLMPYHPPPSGLMAIGFFSRIAGNGFWHFFSSPIFFRKYCNNPANFNVICPYFDKFNPPPTLLMARPLGGELFFAASLSYLDERGLFVVLTCLEQIKVDPALLFKQNNPLWKKDCFKNAI